MPVDRVVNRTGGGVAGVVGDLVGGQTGSAGYGLGCLIHVGLCVILHRDEITARGPFAKSGALLNR